MQSMRPPGNRGIQITREVGDRFGSGFNYMMLVLRGDTPGEAIGLADRAVEGARRLVDQGILYGSGGVTSLLPPPAQQRAVLDWLERERNDGLSVERIEQTFRRELTAEGLRYDAFAGGVGLLGQAVAHEEPIGVDDYLGNPQTEALLERFLKPAKDGGWKSVVYLYPPENQWRRDAPPEATALAEGLGPDAELTGTNVLNERVRQRVLPDAWLAGILGLVLVAILLWLDFRTVRHTLLSLTPLLVGIIWMLAAMGGLGIPLNFMNIFVTTMIIGIGVDYGLHILHRYREERDHGEAELRRGLVETGNAIVVAALSTVCGFGSLAFSHYPGLRSIGYVAILGAISTALVAITLLPAFLAWTRSRRGR
jgi:predicted exporter